MPPADQDFIGCEGQVHQWNNQLVWSLAVTKEHWLQYRVKTIKASRIMLSITLLVVRQLSSKEGELNKLELRAGDSWIQEGSSATLGRPLSVPNQGVLKAQRAVF